MRYLFFLFTLTNLHLLNSQNLIGVNFNSCHSGRTLDLVFSKISKNNFQFDMGVSTNINRKTHNNDLELYHKKKLYVSEFKHLFGIHLCLNKYINQNILHHQIYIFSDLQLKYSSTRNVEHELVYFDSVNNLSFYKEVIKSYGPYVWIQNSYGIGIQMKIIKNLFLYQKIGIGIEFINGPDIKYNGGNRSWVEPALLFNIGLAYKL